MKRGYISLEVSPDDRRNKVVRFTNSGIDYVKKIIPPAADAEINAMGELNSNDIKELVRLTTIFSNYMKNKFDNIEISNMERRI